MSTGSPGCTPADALRLAPHPLPCRKGIFGSKGGAGGIPSRGEQGSPKEETTMENYNLQDHAVPSMRGDDSLLLVHDL